MHRSHLTVRIGHEGEPLPESAIDDVRIVDCTLRDGEQQPGVAFTLDEKLRIARTLDDLGVDEIEAGTPAVSRDDFEAIGAIASDSTIRARTSALARATEKDIDLVKETGAWAVRLSFPISDIQLRAKLGISRAEYLDRSRRACDYAKSQGLAVIFSPYDTVRAELDFVRHTIGELAGSGLVDRFRVVDTSGCSTPERAATYVRTMLETSDVEVEAHFHNDFGLATANTVSAALAGASYMSVTVNGLGERAGNASLEEVVMVLEVLHGIGTGIDTTRLADVSKLVAALSRVNIQAHKAVVGDNAFKHESGLVVSGVVKDPFTAEAYAPELVGRQREIVLGKLSGLDSIQIYTDALGVEIDRETGTELLAWVKDRATTMKGSVTREDLVRHIQDKGLI